MTTIESLTQDLTSLLQETKRRNHEIKNACNSAINQLKAYKSVDQIEDSQQKSIILMPFLMACNSDNVKLITLAIPVIHKLTLARLIPVLNLADLLDGYQEATNLAVDVQLRILQNLPSLLSNYDDQFTGQLLLKLLGICASLTTNNKSTVVINTASATLQQLFSYIFDRQTQSPKLNHPLTVDDTKIMVDDLAYERFQIFQDLCHILNSEQPTYFTKLTNISQLSVLEIIENIITSHAQLFSQNKELGFLLRQKVVPSLLALLNDHIPSTSQSLSNNKVTFPVYIRTMRIILVLLATQLENLEIEAEILLSFLNHSLLDNQNQNSKSTEWEKILVLEMYKTLFADFNVLKSIFVSYDKDPKKKDVVQELTSILLTFVQNNNYLGTESVVPFVASSHSSIQSTRDHANITNTVPYLGRTVSSMKVSILDLLDKSEPPSSIPATYPIYLIYNILLAYADGISKFVQGLSRNDSNSTSLEADVEFTNAFIEASYPHTSELFKSFIYTRADNECFHLLIKSFQRFTHTIGLLGLSELRDGLLLILSKAITTNEKTHSSQKNPKDNGYLEQGKQLLAMGEALVESITGAEQSKINDKNLLVHSRNINSRQITCLRAMSNLANSLGSTLQDSWRVIWITFQWCDYFINGQDEHSGIQYTKQNGSLESTPQLSQQDLQNFTIAENKCLESINDYPPESLYELMSSLIKLSDSAFTEEKLEEKQIKENKTDISLHVCPYNKTYFVDKLLQICKINPNKFFIESEKCWDLVVNHFIKMSTRRTMIYKLRVFFVDIFNKIIISTTREGFSSDNKSVILQTANSTLQALSDFLKGIFALGPSTELLVTNCEIEIHLLILDTLRDLIDTYDTYYQGSWKRVFEIINTPFKSSKHDFEDNSTKDKVKSLINLAYDTLKLILDEFVSTLPSDQLKFLIDTLRNFSSQKYDLNISFSSVSYFWLISDSLKSRIIEKSPTDIDSELSNIKDSQDLSRLLEDEDSSSYAYHVALDLYLLSTLIEACENEQAQARDGAIQTFFQILTSHGDILTASNSFDVIFRVGLPSLLNLKIVKSNEWLESIKLILSGLTSLYGKFEFDYSKWQQLINYLGCLIAFNWIELNLQVFQTFKELLRTVTPELSNLLFEFWGSIEIEYDFINSSYQEYLTTYMNCFPELYRIVGPLNSSQLSIIINSLQKCAMYPILPSNQNDTVKPSKLQRSILDNIEVIRVENGKKHKGEVIHFLANLTTYPFTIKQRVETKFQSQNLLDRFQIATFGALSHLSLRMLSSYFGELNEEDFQELVKEKTTNKLFKSLLELIKQEIEGIDGSEWIEANDLVKMIVKTLMQGKKSYKDDTWKLIIQCITINFSVQHEQEATTRYNELLNIVLPNFLKIENTEMIEHFIEDVYQNSFFYEFNEVELSLIDKNYNTVVENFSNFEFEDTFGTTKPISKFPNQEIRHACLKDLIEFCHTENEHVNKTCSEYLVMRSIIALRRYITDARLLYKCPVTKLQQEELMIILAGLQKVEATKEFRSIHKLLVQLLPLIKQQKLMDETKKLLYRTVKQYRHHI